MSEERDLGNGISVWMIHAQFSKLKTHSLLITRYSLRFAHSCFFVTFAYRSVNQITYQNNEG